MRRLVTLLASAEQGSALATSIAGLAEVQPCSSGEEFRRLAAGHDVAAVVADLRDASGLSTVPELLALQKASPTIPMVVLCALSPSDARAVVGLAGEGFRARWVVAPFESLHAEVRMVLSEDVVGGPEAVIIRKCADMMRTPVRSFLVYAAIGSVRPTSVGMTAESLGMASRSLESQLQRCGMPSPKHVLDWCRVLHVAWHIDVLNRSGKGATGALAFPSQSAMGNLVLRVTGQSPMGMRRDAGFSSLLDRFVELLRSERRDDGTRA